MKTPKNFDYDLWTTEDGRYFSRLKRTGEVSEISHEVMKFLRNEEKKLRRELQGVSVPASNDGNAPKVIITVLSLYCAQADDEVSANWLIDTTDYETVVYTKLLEQEFCKLLTDKQLDVYLKCLLGGMSFVEYAERNGVYESAIRKIVNRIRKKAKSFFE